MTDLTPSQAYRNHVEIRLMLIKWVAELEEWQMLAVWDVVEMLHNGELDIEDEEAVYNEYCWRCKLYDIEESNC